MCLSVVSVATGCADGDEFFPDAVDPSTTDTGGTADDTDGTGATDDGTTTGDTATGDDDVGTADAGDTTGTGDPDAGTTDGVGPDWNRVNLGTHETIHAVWGPGDGTYYAAGDHGALHWYNGHTWTPQPHLTDADLYGVGGVPGGDVFVVGAHGTLLRRDNAGWNVLTSGTDVDLHGVYGLAADDVLMVGDAGTILKFTGSAILAVESNTTEDLRSVFRPPGGVPMVGGSGGQIHRFFGGQWVSNQATGSGTTITGIWGTSSKFVVAVGTDGIILVSTGGNTWSAQTSNDIKDRDLYGVWGTSNEDVFLVGDEGVVIYYNGSKWTVVETDGPLYTTAHFRGVWGAAAGDIVTAYAVGVSGAILGFESEGGRWRDRSSGPDLTVSDIVGLSADDFVACGHRGLLMRWDAMRGWAGLSSGTSADFHACEAVGDQAVLAVGDGGAAVRISGLDRSEVIDTGTTKPLYGVARAGELVMVVGAGGAAFRVTADGWESESTGTVARLSDVWAGADGAAIAVGESGVIVVRDGSGDWTDEEVPTSNNLHAVTVVGSTVFAAGNNGVILVRDVSGGSWTREYEAPGDFVYGLWGDDGDIFAVGWTGLVLRRDGQTWVEENSDTSNVLEAVAGAPGGPTWVVGRQGTLLERR